MVRDQAERLRRALSRPRRPASPRTIAVASGKGGVGKSNLSLNLSVSLSELGFRVLLLDMDVGMGNIDILLGQSSPLTLADWFSTRLPLSDIVKSGPGQLSYIAGGTGVAQWRTLDMAGIDYFLAELQAIASRYDYLIFDMGAGVSEERLYFLKSVDDVFIVTTPEPTAVTDAYAMMKYMHAAGSEAPFSIIVNRTSCGQEGYGVFQRLKDAAARFLNKPIALLGIVPEDRVVARAVVSQMPFVLLDPKAKASQAVRQMAWRYAMGREGEPAPPGQIPRFFAMLRQFLLER
ncbi:MinD/ParA family protein [Geobacillus stearothermophilus]|uniref:MinD/ParA family protein n=1 Tax=Geobacillus stearothermophilus TaxID=1422 RepID=UPI000EF5EBFF|nr:MinD/ParA family protein [Geobacillus stearothermophilus]MED3664460.1 MinD/ParA family protein [Geobacillus stearothermophilus]MED3719358.1 MinD/ParA family protein [Geobacillus stearothermophilus]RLQ01952.1 MinD/ParA family protein [Geobacillus stearothermophilus]